MEFNIRVRALIIHEGKLLVFKLRPTDDWWSLPGGKLEPGESLKAGMERELIEETGIKPELGRVLCVQDLLLPTWDRHSVEFFYEVKNPLAYTTIDFTGATHGFEVSEQAFVDVNAETHRILPVVLKEIVNEINQKGVDQFTFKIFEGGENNSN